AVVVGVGLEPEPVDHDLVGGDLDRVPAAAAITLDRDVGEPDAVDAGQRDGQVAALQVGGQREDVAVLLPAALARQLDVEVELPAEGQLDARAELGLQRLLEHLLRVDLAAGVRRRGVRLLRRHLALLGRLLALGLLGTLAVPRTVLAGSCTRGRRVAARRALARTRVAAGTAARAVLRTVGRVRRALAGLVAGAGLGRAVRRRLRRLRLVRVVADPEDDAPEGRVGGRRGLRGAVGRGRHRGRRRQARTTQRHRARDDNSGRLLRQRAQGTAERGLAVGLVRGRTRRARRLVGARGTC